MNESESEWLVRAQKGDDVAFARLVELYQKPVYNLCYRMLGNPGDAEDAAQEAFLRAYKNLRRYDSDRPFATWLLSIASHYCIDQLRKQRFNAFSLDDDENTWLEPPDPGMGPEASLSAQEKQAQVQTLLDQLSPKDRAAVVMHYWYDYSYEEIAQELSLTVSAVKSRLHRCRRELAGQWQAVQAKTAERINPERMRNESPAF
ncbi:MAG TPA: RNA polymerase subunit sigma-24 [Chloroflexi bacterium]|nr:RNA polymerase subunit sigma-24 [Chloroflexota bacterium]HBY06807.1 RNA polymerase subunit sigma-24 [Chloroflexota bacterium]